MHPDRGGKFVGYIAPDQEGTDSFDYAWIFASIAHRTIPAANVIFPAVRG